MSIYVVIRSYCNSSSPGKCDGSLLEGVDGDVIGGEVLQVVEELVLHGRRQRVLEVLNVCKGHNFICLSYFIATTLKSYRLSSVMLEPGSRKRNLTCYDYLQVWYQPKNLGSKYEWKDRYSAKLSLFAYQISAKCY